MIQIIGYMVAAYGTSRLIQTTIETDNDSSRVFGFLGIGALLILTIWLTQQGNAIADLGDL